ncbi:MAG: sulfurase [Pseudomonadota bacterium]
MPVLNPTEIYGEVVWLGRVGDRARSPQSAPADRLDLDFDGVIGEAHGGPTRPSCGRVQRQYAMGTTIRNTRQLSIVSDEELKDVADRMGLPELTPDLLGATLVLRGVPELSHIPPSTRLIAEDGPSLTVDMENRPCQIPAREIEARHPGAGAKFKAASRERRGVVAWVERPGALTLGMRLRAHLPNIFPYPHRG